MVEGADAVDSRVQAATAAILDAAESELVTHGFEGTRMDDVAGRAGVAVGSIYTHFDGKVGLYVAVVDRALAVEEARLREALDGPGSPDERLRRAGEAYLHFCLDHPGYFRLLTRPPEDRDMRISEATRAQIRDLEDRGRQLISALADLIAEGVATGDLRPVDPQRTATFLWGAWTGVIGLHMRADHLRLGDDELDATLAAGREIVAAGLSAEAP